MTEALIFVILAVIVVGFGVLIYFVRSKPKEDESVKVMMEWMRDIKKDTDSTRDSVQKTINETNKAINERLDNAGRVIAELSKQLGGVSQIGPDIRRLTETLSSPKMRGNFGEEMLESLISQVLPRTAYQMQYKFKNGETVDAIIWISDKILPIDSKFSMENFRLYKEAKEEGAAENLKKTFLRDIKKRVDEIHKKYILPQENTYDFALMFIPSEGVYMEVADSSEVIQYSRDKKVVFVGPNTLYLTLQTFLVSLKGQQINKAAKDILAMISGIKQESDKFAKALDVLGTHVKNTNLAMDKVGGGYVKLQASIDNASTLQLPDSDKNKDQQILLDN
ncbi:MAG: DNA recombination protein RmuC [Candidatus Doudnabacteria bacterium]|nr:DNA recombination protein RmuC [Candidatus Doudnabacteria bacterium]